MGGSKRKGLPTKDAAWPGSNAASQALCTPCLPGSQAKVPRGLCSPSVHFMSQKDRGLERRHAGSLPEQGHPDVVKRLEGTEVLLGPTPPSWGTPLRSNSPHFSKEETVAPEGTDLPQLHGRQVEVLRLSPAQTWSHTPHTVTLEGPPPLCQVISTSEHQRRPRACPRGCRFPLPLESHRRPVTGGGWGRFTRTPEDPDGLGSSDEPQEAVTF